MYSKEKELKLTHKVYITEREYRVLRKERVKQKISMAKIVCNLINKEYE